MPRLTTISTTKGDDGKTSLGSRQRVGKNSLRVATYGTVDELSSHLGLALAHGVSSRLEGVVTRIQSELFNLGADLSYLEEDKKELKLPQIEKRHVTQLTELVEALTGEVGPLENFILPGGTVASAQLHVARTVCRRAEREAVALAEVEPIGDQVIAYLNRLSDALFMMARYENVSRGVEEPLWDTAV